MAPKLTPEEIVTLHVLKQKGQSHTQIAQALGITEGAVRYHLRRQGQPDGRKNKPRKAASLAQAIDHWVGLQRPGDPGRPVNIQALFDWLRAEHGYDGSYKSVLRFVRGRYPKPRLRPFRRVETPPGAQAQVDWGEFPGLDVGDGPQLLYGFVLVLAHSRKEVLCPATGETVEASWQAEQARLRPLPAPLPVPFDVAVTRPVQRDCTVCFEGRVYSVPFVLCGRAVEVRGGAEVVQVLHDGRVMAEHPRHSRQRLLLDPAHYDGPGDERVAPPVPLGKLGRRLQEIVAQPVEQRPLDLYAALAEVAR